MSKRRKIGDRVWIVPGGGIGASKGEWGKIIDWPANRDEDCCLCMLDCGDDKCREWDDIRLERGCMAYHVSECEMFDEGI